jgi:hypothetical protein
MKSLSIGKLFIVAGMACIVITIAEGLEKGRSLWLTATSAVLLATAILTLL